MCDGSRSNTEDRQPRRVGRSRGCTRCSFRSDAACEGGPSGHLTLQHTFPADGYLSQQCVYFLKVRSYTYDISYSLMAITRGLERTIPTRKVMFWAAGRWRAGPSVSGKPWWEDHDKLVTLGQHREQLLTVVFR